MVWIFGIQIFRSGPEDVCSVTSDMGIQILFPPTRLLSSWKYDRIDLIKNDEIINDSASRMIHSGRR